MAEIHCTKHSVLQAQMRLPGRLCDTKREVEHWMVAEVALALDEGRRSASSPRWLVGNAPRRRRRAGRGHVRMLWPRDRSCCFVVRRIGAVWLVLTVLAPHPSFVEVAAA
jgi:hypothetical protein